MIRDYICRIVLLMGSMVLGLTACQQRPDVFYIISTEVLAAFDDQGEEMFNSTLIPSDTVYMYQEKEFVKENYASGLRFYAPYYEQFTMNAIKAPKEVYDTAYVHAKNDLQKRFNDYMAHENNHRPYVIVGFSQGGMIAIDLLKEMTEEQYKLCKGAYLLGYRLSEEDLKHPHIVPATSLRKGKVASFNSTMSAESSWDLVSKDAATCVNPLNWKTDETPATLIFEGDTATVQVDKSINQLIVKGLDEDQYVFAPLNDFCVKGNLHHWDLLFYKEAISKRIKTRVR